MKTIQVDMDYGTDSRSRRVVKELKQSGFEYRPLLQQWHKNVEDDNADFWLKQFKQCGLTACAK